MSIWEGKAHVLHSFSPNKRDFGTWGVKADVCTYPGHAWGTEMIWCGGRCDLLLAKKVETRIYGEPKKKKCLITDVIFQSCIYLPLCWCMVVESISRCVPSWGCDHPTLNKDMENPFDLQSKKNAIPFFICGLTGFMVKDRTTGIVSYGIIQNYVSGTQEFRLHVDLLTPV